MGETTTTTTSADLPARGPAAPLIVLAVGVLVLGVGPGVGLFGPHEAAPQGRPAGSVALVGSGVEATPAAPFRAVVDADLAPRRQVGSFPVSRRSSLDH